MRWKGGSGLSNKPLSAAFIKNLLRKKVPDLASNNHSIFSEEESKLIREIVEGNGVKQFNLRGREFRVKRFRFKGQDWVTISPKEGYVPLISGEVKWLLDKEKEL